VKGGESEKWGSRTRGSSSLRMASALVQSKRRATREIGGASSTGRGRGGQGGKVETGESGDRGRAGGRPAEEFAYSEQALEVTDPFATLRPPE